jgi:flagellar hook-basal body complex protein FliE
MIAALPAIGSIFAGLATDEVARTILPQPTESVEFSRVLAGVGEAVDRLKTAEATSISALDGKASVQQVVESVVAAEQSLHTVLAVRDKVVSAYQSVAQMPI